MTTIWPPPWTLKPTSGEPHDSSDIDGESIGWDLSFGFRLNVDHDDFEDHSTPLTINAHFSDADKERGFVKREVTPEQLAEFGRLLLNIAAKQRQRAGRWPGEQQRNQHPRRGHVHDRASWRPDRRRGLVWSRRALLHRRRDWGGINVHHGGAGHGASDVHRRSVRRGARRGRGA